MESRDVQALSPAFSPGAPQFAPHASDATEATRAAILSLGTAPPARGLAVYPRGGRPEVVRRRLQRSLLVARLWPDMTLLFAARVGDVRCKHGQTGQWQTCRS
jgi:hypothetical protein